MRKVRFRSLRERFQNKVSVRGPDECWEWIGAKTGGYGQIGIGDRKIASAHRVAWMLEHGPILNGLYVLHRCDNPGCVNTRHLFLGNPADNMRDMSEKLRGCSGRRKLTDNDVMEACKMKDAGMSNTDIAEKFGVQQPAICKALRGYTRRFQELRKAHLAEDVSKTACSECMKG